MRAPTSVGGLTLGAFLLAGSAGAEDFEHLRRFDVPEHKLSRFHADLANNFAGVLATPSVRPMVVGGLGAMAASAADHATMRYFERHPMPTLGKTGAWLGTGTTVLGMTAGFLVAGQVGHGDRFRAATYDMSQAVIVNGAYTFAIKNAVGRQRPDGGDRLSFPSGHTSNAFAVATVWARHYGTKAAIPAYAAAGLVGVSRMASRKHHLSDVVVGAALGYTVGRTVTRHLGDGDRRLSVGLDPGPAGDGVGLGVRLDF